MARKPLLQVRVDAEELDRLDRIAAERATKRQDVVREALAAFTGEPATAAPAAGARMEADELLGLIERQARDGRTWAVEWLARRVLAPKSVDPETELAVDFRAALERREAAG